MERIVPPTIDNSEIQFQGIKSYQFLPIQGAPTIQYPGFQLQDLKRCIIDKDFFSVEIETLHTELLEPLELSRIDTFLCVEIEAMCHEAANN